MQPGQNVQSTNIFYPFLIPFPPPTYPSPDFQPGFRKPFENGNSSTILDLQVLTSHLLAIPGVVSQATRRLLVNYLPKSHETAPVEQIILWAKDHIAALSRDQLFSEVKACHQVIGYLNFHANGGCLGKVIEDVKIRVQELKDLVEERVNFKLMENQGLGTVGLSQQVLSLKTNEELLQFLGALREKELQARVDLNFAPYRAQRVVAENQLNCTRRKISQVEDEWGFRVRRDGVAGPRMCRKEPHFDAFYC